MTGTREQSVFINCPFDKKYKRLFNAIVFTVVFCGYDVRSALEEDDSANVRLLKIIALIKQSRFSLHDISRVELDPETSLPRFNMPLELGAAIGLRHSGEAKQEDHQILILDAHAYRYQKFVSDLAGVDIKGHDDTVSGVIRCVRTFLSSKSSQPLPSPSVISKVYRLFERTLPELARRHRQTKRELTYHDRMLHLQAFLDSRR